MKDQIMVIYKIAFLANLFIIICMFGSLSFLAYKDERNIKIYEYNYKTGLWNTQGLSLFNDTAFTIVANKNLYNFTAVDTIPDQFYPLHDGCDVQDDDQACVQSNELYYGTSVSKVGNDISITIYNKGKIIFTDKTATRRTKNLYPVDLNCTDDVDICSMYCSNQGGQWDDVNIVCYLKTYLNTICYRLQEKSFFNETSQHAEFTWNLDIPPKYNLNGYRPDDVSQFGCSYLNKWSPYIYKATKPLDVQIELRSAWSPYIVASSITRGCSDMYIGNQHCLGERNNSAYISSLSAFIVTASLFAVGIIFCCIWGFYITYRRRHPKQDGGKVNEILLYDTDKLDPVASYSKSSYTISISPK
ncbi:hypothetical protein WA158_005594 [Blastocystis sp. Blastoise]